MGLLTYISNLLYPRILNLLNTMAKQNEPKKVIPQTKSVHVVFFSCQNCGQEVDYIQFCPDCGNPMRVIDVVEKFGEDADEFVKKIEDRLADGNLAKDNPAIPSPINEEESNVIILSEEDHVEELDDVNSVEDINSLDDIFPDDSDSDEKPHNPEELDLSDMDDIVAELDKEDDDFSMDDFGDDGLPEL
jgi:hypothetical protein